MLLYLWLAFGGTSPLQPKGYRFHVQFPEATQLAEQADVRIAGVPVGKVVSLEAGRATARTRRSRCAPATRPSRVTPGRCCGTKTLLGETFVDLTPGNERSGDAAGRRDAAALGGGRHGRARRDLPLLRRRDAQRRSGPGCSPRPRRPRAAGRTSTRCSATCPSSSSASDDLLRELNAQSEAVSETFAATGEFFDAISERDGQLRNLIVQSERLWAVTARRNREFAAIWKEFPRFERESRLTLPRLTRFAEIGEPVVEELQPAATEMAGTFDAFRRLAPEYRGFFQRLGPVISASKQGVPALERTHDGSCRRCSSSSSPGCATSTR